MYNVTVNIRQYVLCKRFDIISRKKKYHVEKYSPSPPPKNAKNAIKLYLMVAIYKIIAKTK